MTRKNICIVCHSKKFTYLFTINNKKIIQCNNCNLMQTAAFTSPNYSNYHRDEAYSDSERFMKYFFEKRLEFINKFSTRPGIVLEIGASTGVFLDLLKSQGWKTWGVEPSMSAQKAIIKGHKIIQKSFETSALPKESFDLIVANHVIEHIENPNLFLDKAYRSLKKGGLLFIDVPNAGSLTEKLMQSSWPYFLPEEHVSHFTKETLQMIIQKANFRIVFVKTKSGIFEVSHPLRYLFAELTSLKKNFFWDILRIPENVAANFLDQGSSVTVIATK